MRASRIGGQQWPPEHYFRPQLKMGGVQVYFHKTIPQEFYQIAFRRKIYRSIEELQIDLDDWLHHYN